MELLIGTPLIGLEFLQRQAFRVLFENLNGVIEEIESYMALSDEEISTLTGREYVPTTIERIDAANFYEGHRPSLMDGSVERYPNVAVMAFNASANDDDDLDQLDSYRDLLTVEAMVKSLNSEEEVNRRIQRTAEAVNITLLRDQTLGGIITGFEGVPAVEVSNVFKAKSSKGYGADWLWQGVRLDYVVRKEAVRPTSSTSEIFRASPEVGRNSIDYSRFIDQG
jgi:hypothetical protein